MKAKTVHDEPAVWTGYHHPAQDSFKPMPIVPFPELSYIIPTGEHATSKHKTKTPCQSKQSKRVESKSIALKKGSPGASSPIPFPEDHIQKTPSELQLDRNKLQAEYDIVQMKARIAVAKQLRAQIHPRRFLSSKDLPGQNEACKKALSLENQQQPRRSSGVGWEPLAYVCIDSSPKFREGSRRSFVNTMRTKDGEEADEYDDIFSLDL